MRLPFLDVLVQALPLDSQHTLIERYRFLIVSCTSRKAAISSKSFSHFGMPWSLAKFPYVKSSHIQRFCLCVHSLLLIYVC